MSYFLHYHNKLKIHRSKNLYFLSNRYEKRPPTEDHREKLRHAITWYQNHECHSLQVKLIS